MRLTILISLLLFSKISFQQSVYDIQVQDYSGKQVQLSLFKGEKILVASVSPDNLQNGQFKFLDSLQLANPSIAVIGIAANDFGGTNNNTVLYSLTTGIKPAFVLSGLTQVKKANGVLQNQLMRWLTNSSENSHFDADVTTDDQLYLVSETGVLYGVLEKGASSDIINNLLKQTNIK